MPLAVPMSNGTASTRPKVLVPEKISSDGLALLQASVEVHERKGLSPEDLLAIIGEYDALIVRSETKVTAKLLAAGKKLKVVARAGVGVDNIDVDVATKHGIIVVNSPVGNINAAAEHTIALLMAVARNIGEASSSIKAGRWERSRLVGVEVKGKVLGIIGLGKVGLTVARIAGGMGMTLQAFDPYANPSMASAASVKLLPSFAELLEQADFLTIHTPLIASTKGMIGAAELATMKSTARILNVARGGMIDEDALIAALDAGTIAGAGIDVFTSEPPLPSSSASRLSTHPKVVATPHLGASTIEAQENVSMDVCTQVLSILSGAMPRSAVNAPIILPDEYRTLQPFVALMEKMGALYTQHYHHDRQRRTTFDVTYDGALAALASTQPLFAALVKGLLAPITSPHDALPVNIVNAELVARERGILVNEARSRESLGPADGYSSSITLRARLDARSPAATSSDAASSMFDSRSGTTSLLQAEEHTIAGFVSHNTPYISRLGRFRTSFVPSGTLLICRNFDSPGKIGRVGGLLGRAGVNIRFMSVAPVDRDEGRRQLDVGKEGLGMVDGAAWAEGRGGGETEALMILGVDGVVEEEVRRALVGENGVLEASVVLL